MAANGKHYQRKHPIWELSETIANDGLWCWKGELVKRPRLWSVIRQTNIISGQISGHRLRAGAGARSNRPQIGKISKLWASSIPIKILLLGTSNTYFVLFNIVPCVRWVWAGCRHIESPRDLAASQWSLEARVTRLWWDDATLHGRGLSDTLHITRHKHTPVTGTRGQSSDSDWLLKITRQLKLFMYRYIFFFLTSLLSKAKTVKFISLCPEHT